MGLRDTQSHRAPTAIRVLPWTEEDVPWLRKACLAYLTAEAARGNDLAPTEGNAERLIRLGLALARYGDPCYVAHLPEGPVAFVLWGDPQQLAPPEMRMELRRKFCQGLASYTEPAYRSMHIAELLRDHAWVRAFELGYETITGSVSSNNYRGIEHLCGEKDAWPMRIQVESPLTQEGYDALAPTLKKRSIV